jgi:hypothetical protein
MEDSSWMEEYIVKCTPTIPLSSTSSVDMTTFVDAHKVVVQRSAFTLLEDVKNDGVS